MKSGIYQIVNKINNKVYIGSSQDVNQRFRKHKELLRRNKHHSIKLQRAWNKHKLESFEFIVICLCSTKDLLTLEQFHIDELKPFYNIAKNSSAPMRGRKESLEHRQKISIKLKGKKKSPFTEQHKLNLSKSHLGHIPWNKNKPMKESTRQKLLLTRKRKAVRCSNGIVYSSITEAAQKLGLHKSLVWKVVSGRSKHTGNFKFKYE